MIGKMKGVAWLLSVFCVVVIYHTASGIWNSENTVNTKTRLAAEKQVIDAAKDVEGLFSEIRKGVVEVEVDTLALLAKAKEARMHSATNGPANPAVAKTLSEGLFSSLAAKANGSKYHQLGVAFSSDVLSNYGVGALGIQHAHLEYCFNQSQGDQRWGEFVSFEPVLSGGDSAASHTKPLPSQEFSLAFKKGGQRYLTAKSISEGDVRIVGRYSESYKKKFIEFADSEGNQTTFVSALEGAVKEYLQRGFAEDFFNLDNERQQEMWLRGLREHTQDLLRWQSLAVEWRASDASERDVSSECSSEIHDSEYPHQARLDLSESSFCFVRYDNKCDVGYYDHTSTAPELETKTKWYQKALASRGWKPAYYGSDARKWLAEYNLPLEQHGKKLGVAYGNISLLKARDVLASQPLGAKGYAVLIGFQNNILSHPVKDFLTRDVGDTADEQLKAVLEELEALDANGAGSDTAESTDFADFMNLKLKDRDGSTFEKRVYVGSKKIMPPKQAKYGSSSTSGADQKVSNFIRLVFILDPTDFEQNEWEVRRGWLKLILACFLLLSSVSFIVLGSAKSDLKSRSAKLSVFAAIVSILAIVALGLIWRAVYLYGDEAIVDLHECSSLGERAAQYKNDHKALFFPDNGTTLGADSTGGGESECTKTNTSSSSDSKGAQIALSDSVPVYNVEEALAYLSVFNADGREHIRERDILNIRVFVQSLDFTSANNVSLTGYVWTTFPDSYKNKDVLALTPVFPEAEAVEFSDGVKRVDARGNINVRWYFTTTLRQQFDYRKYPFDREDVWIRIWPHDLYENTVLIPDFTSYTSNSSNKIYGVEKDIVLDGWALVNSHFSYKKNEYNTTLSVNSGGAMFDVPELYFNVGLARVFVDPFIADMLPIVIVCLLVFAVLLITTVKAGDVDLKGFSSANVLSYCAALYFVLIVSHVHLRETLNAYGIIYLEIFYFCMYFIILLVSANSLAITSDRTPKFIREDDNFIARLMYFPFITITLLMATVWMFY